MDQTSKGDLSADWTTQLERWPCTDKSTKALQKLPRVRELTLRPRRLDLSKPKHMNFKPKKNHEAALGQVCGELALAKCLRCANGKGPFVECVIVDGRFAKACCNCHYSSQGLSCSFRDIDSGAVSTPNELHATRNTLDEQANPTKMTASAVFAGPQVSQSDDNSVSTRLRSKKENLQKPPTFSKDSASSRTFVDLTVNEPLSRKRQRQEATITGLGLEQSQPEQGTDAVHQASEETIQRLEEEIQRLRRENSDQTAREIALIKGFVTSAAVVEIAVDVRGAELHCGLSNMGGTPGETQEQVQQMIHFSNATSRHVSRFVHDMLKEQQAFLNDDQQKTMRLGYASAQLSPAVKAILDERLSFMMGLSEEQA